MVKEKASKKSGDKQKKRKSEGEPKRKPRREKRALAADSAPVKSRSASAKAFPVGNAAAASTITELAPMEEDLSSSECIVWRFGEFRQRVRQAVAEWALESASSILPTNTLGELAKGTPWNTGQQAQLVQSTNANRVFEPPFPGTFMNPPDQLLPSSTTVLEWEAEVWSRQTPPTHCLAVTD